MARLLKSRLTTKKNIIENIKLYCKGFAKKVFFKRDTAQCTANVADMHMHACLKMATADKCTP